MERLAERLGLTPPTISFHLKKLADVGAVRSYKTQYYTMYAICQDVFQSRIIDIIKEESDEAKLQERRELEYRERVLAAYFEYGRLKLIPAQRKKKHIIYEEIAKQFESGRIYTEREVNIIIADFHDDFCTIRRDMISDKILDRNQDGYWLVEK